MKIMISVSINFLSDVVTEVWELEFRNKKIIKPTLPEYHYTNGIALFAVDADFCRK